MSELFNKIGIVYNPELKETQNLAQKISQKFLPNLCSIFSIDDLKNNVDLILTIGGDGTFLKTARFYSEFDIPILGLNMGRLGYLAQAYPEEIDFVVENIKNKNFEIEKRIMLEANNNVALNDIIVKGINPARTSTLDLYINNKKLCSYVADGLIVSTPTGSTAYSLSAGGPIVAPNIDCFLVIPICPHTLNTRPIVIPSNEKIAIRAYESNQKISVSYDGQVCSSFDNEITIKKSNKNASLLILNQQKDKFYDILKEKLHWSLAPNK